MVSNHKEVQQNTTHEGLLLDTPVAVNEADNINATTENSNFTAKTGNGYRHQQNRKKNSEQEQDKKSNKEQKKGKSVFLLVGSMVKHLRCWEMPKKKKKIVKYKYEVFPAQKCSVWTIIRNRQ